MTASVDDIVKFWFAPAARTLWFASSAAFDADIRDRFMATYQAARDGQYDTWRQRPDSLLALIIVFDQFPRNMFRHDGRAFATDALARALTKEGIAKGFDHGFDAAQLDFFYLPLMHSESLADHDILVERGRGTDRYAREHRGLIVRFGRFPHRNAALGRSNSPEEALFLAADRETA